MIQISKNQARIVAAGICVLLALGGSVFAAETPQGQVTERTTAWFDGRTEFTNHCAACHGVDAKGHGPVAALMTISLPDLTGLSARHGGVFPYEFARAAIGARKQPRAHGTLEMPVWGKHYSEGRNDRVGQTQANTHIYELLIYLQSIQEPVPLARKPE
jgi:cytochrome c2